MNSGQITDLIIQVIINVMVNPSDHCWMKALKQLILVLVLTQFSEFKSEKGNFLKINVGWLLFKQSCTYMPIKYFIWYVIVAGWQETSPYYLSAYLSPPMWKGSILQANGESSGEPALPCLHTRGSFKLRVRDLAPLDASACMLEGSQTAATWQNQQSECAPSKDSASTQSDLSLRCACNG